MRFGSIHRTEVSRAGKTKQGSDRNPLKGSPEESPGCRVPYVMYNPRTKQTSNSVVTKSALLYIMYN